MAAQENNEDVAFLSEEQTEEFREAFGLFDLDGGGDIDASELGTVMRSLGANPSDEEIKAIINEVDDNGSGSIDFPEFCALMARKLQVSDCAEELQEAFHVYDDKQTGFISRYDLREIVAGLADGLSAEEVDEIVQIAVKSEERWDGRVSFEAFRALMMMHKWRPEDLSKAK